jgi:NAD-dependent SIR2 family protein deacetylase
MTYTANFSERIKTLKQQIDQADHIIIGAGSGLSSAAGIDYAGPDFRREFREWIDRYGITDLYSSSFYPFKTEEERWACWAKHIWFARYQPEAKLLYKQLLDLVKDKDYFVITTNVDGQFQKAGFDTERIFATQGDYGLFQPASGYPQETNSNREWVEKVLPHIRDCRIPTELIPTTPDGQPVAMNLRCDDTFVEDAHWHEQAHRYHDFIEKARNGQLLLLELGVGFNTPVIIRFPFERMTMEFPHTSLVRFNRDYPHTMNRGVRNFTYFTEDINQVFAQVSVNLPS